MLFDPKIGHGICAILCMPCACSECTSMIEKPWICVLTEQQQPGYQPVIYCTYFPVLVSFNNCNIIIFLYKVATREDFEEIIRVFIYGIGDNISSLFQYGQYSATNTTDT